MMLHKYHENSFRVAGKPENIRAGFKLEYGVTEENNEPQMHYIVPGGGLSTGIRVNSVY
jgi:hypothetical protein